MSTLCVCGHARAYHRMKVIDCTIWACYCTEYEKAEQATLLEDAG